MPRTLPQSFRRTAEALYSDDILIWLAVISHPLLIEPIRVNWLPRDCLYEGETYTGFAFDIGFLSDDENPPRAQLVIQNVDPRIGDTIRKLRSAPRLSLTLLSGSDFDLTVNPHVANGSPPPEIIYAADKLFLTNVKVDPISVTADIVGWDYLQKVWPGRRATKDLFPALFR